MAKGTTSSRLRSLSTLFCLGKVGDRTDGELLQWFTTRHAEAETAVEEMVARHGKMVLGVCRQVLHDSHDVDDAFQATFLILLLRSGSIRNPESLGGWLHRVALRVALRARTESAHRRAISPPLDPPAAFELTADELERAELRTAVHEELDRLPTSYRMALVACYLEGLTHEEAARRLRWPVGTVRSRLARGREQLRRRLTRRGLALGFILPAVSTRARLVPAVLRRSAVELILSYFDGHARGAKPYASAVAMAERMIHAMRRKSLITFTSIGVVAGMAASLVTILMLEQPPIARAGANETTSRDPELVTSLSGRVRDLQGKPVEGATVVAGSFTGKVNHVTTTSGPDGRFAFHAKRGERKLEYALAYKNHLALASKFDLGSFQGATSGEIDLVLSEAERFYGRLENRDRQPVVGAHVWIRYMKGPAGQSDSNPILENVVQGSPLESLVHTVTDNQGHFQFPAVPTPQGVILHASADGMGDLSTEVPRKFEDGYVRGTFDAPTRLIMHPEARVKGRVASRLPAVKLAGLKIALQSTNDSTQFWRESTTDVEGHFEMRALPEGTCNIFLSDDPGAGPWAYRAIDGLHLHHGETAEVTLELIEGVRVEGQIVDAESRVPIAGAAVATYGPARPRSGAAVMSAKSDDQGRFRFTLPPGESTFYLLSRELVAPMQNVSIPECNQVFKMRVFEARKRPRATSGEGFAK